MFSAHLWDKFAEASEDVPQTWDSWKEKLSGAQAQIQEAPLWDKFIEARKNVPGTWDSLKDTLIGAHAKFEDLDASLWAKLKEVNKDVPKTWGELKETSIGSKAQIDCVSQALWNKLNDEQHRSATVPLAVAGAVCLAPFAVISLLGVIGFSATGPVAGTMAASMQSSIGLVEAGSAFALAQSFTMTPAILAIANGMAVLGAGAIAAAGLLAYDELARLSISWDDGKYFQPDPELVGKLVEGHAYDQCLLPP